MKRTLLHRLNFIEQIFFVSPYQIVIMKNLSILCSILLFASQQSNAQFTQQWVHRLGSTGGDNAYGIATDASGNVIITGNFSGTADFDPGAGTHNLTATANGDAFLAKYNSSGSLLWAHALGGSDTDIGEAVAADGAGNVYIGISFGNVIDMDPGAGVASFTSPGFSSSIIAKYDANGNYVWGFMLASLSSSGISDIKVDAANNVYFTGSFHGTVDFDPGLGVNNLVSNGNSDIFFAKYDANGNYLLAKSFGAGAFDTGTHLHLDASQAIYVSGYYRFTVDFDPGAGVANITASGTLNDIFFAKYDPLGNYVWARSLGSTSNDIPGGLSVDAAGNVIVSGGFSGTVDFDPGAGTAHLTALGRDIFIAKYDIGGNYTWAKRIGFTGTETAYAITGDGSGGFYIAGEFTSTVDFDADAPVSNLTAFGNTDIFLARYTANGVFVNAGGLGGISSEIAMDMALVDANNVLVTGYFQGTADFDPGAGVNNLTSAGVFDIYFGKYRSTTGALPVTLSSFAGECVGKEILVKWRSRQEQHTKHYVVERSFTGINFENVAVIAAAGNSNAPVDYSFIDKNIAAANKTIYYRLKQVDADSTFTYSKIITVSCAMTEQDVQLFPNPAERDVTIALKNEKITAVTIFDLSGKKVMQLKPVILSGKILIDVRALQRGIYSILIETETGHVFKKLIR